MNETKAPHSPGPWTAHFSRPWTEPFRSGTNAPQAEGSDILFHIRDSSLKWVVSATRFPDFLTSSQEVAANARLIAKAPEMYELIKTMAQYWYEGGRIAALHGDALLGADDTTISRGCENLIAAIEGEPNES